MLNQGNKHQQSPVLGIWMYLEGRRSAGVVIGWWLITLCYDFRRTRGRAEEDVCEMDQFTTSQSEFHALLLMG